MRVSRERAVKNRERVLDTAARLLRERGYDGVSVAGIMAAAGLTHGGFYARFASKDDLEVQATSRAAAVMAAALRAGLDLSPNDPFGTLIRYYVSAQHRDSPGFGCILPALAADAARRNIPEIRPIFTAVIQNYLDELARLAPTMPDNARCRRPGAILSEMVGAVLLSRVISDHAMADALIGDVVADIIGTSRPQPEAQNTDTSHTR
jgi:TetR/AcrR family transcriptional regulator, transcriptional repressor for nem operon